MADDADRALKDAEVLDEAHIRGDKRKSSEHAQGCAWYLQAL